MFLHTIRTALRSITRNRMRTLLTMLGIVIGVAAVIIMVSIGNGASADIQNRISSLGTNLLMVRPGNDNMHGVSTGAGSRTSLNLSDIANIREEASEIVAVSALVRYSGQVVSGQANWSTSVEGVHENYPQIRSWKLSKGEFFTERDIQTSRKVAVLGKTVANELFGSIDPVGSRIRIGTQPFTVIGVMAERGQSGMGGDQDDVVLAPATTVYYRLAGQGRIHQILASAKSQARMTQASEELTVLLRKAHKLGPKEEDDFQIRSQSDILETASSMSKTLTMLLGAIAGVSLLVGGIGIMNIMLVSVTERTREIGIRMALGARGKDILTQFLVEAVVLCSLGGLIGIGLAVGVCLGLEAWVSMPVILDPPVIFGSFLFTGLVGVFFGFYPAQKAARMNPIEALRYE